MTFELSSPVPNQVNPRGRPHLPGTHGGEPPAVSLIRVIPTVVLAVAGQRGVDAASCVKAITARQRHEKRLVGGGLCKTPFDSKAWIPEENVTVQLFY